jgi:hypothetical protein
MDHTPDEEGPAVARTAHEVVREVINAGVYVSAGGLVNEPASIVATDGTVGSGPYPEAIGGFTLVEVPSREEALEWAAKIAVACRCAQEVREIGHDPELDEMLRGTGGVPRPRSEGRASDRNAAAGSGCAASWLCTTAG